MIIRGGHYTSVTRPLQLLWRQLSTSGLFELLRSIKAYFLLGRGELFHSLLQARNGTRNGTWNGTRRRHVERHAETARGTVCVVAVTLHV